MTKMIIDNKATAKKPYEVYTIDEHEYFTITDLEELVEDFITDDVWSLTVEKNGNKVIEYFPARRIYTVIKENW